MTGIFDAYITGDPGVSRFFSGGPRAVLRERPPCATLDERLVAAIGGFQTRLGGEAPSLSSSDAVVVTGQQPALFLGPLYTVYKAITALRLAERIEASFGVRCAPVFWIAGDDHDFAEASSASFLSRAHEPFSLTYAPEASVQGQPLYLIALEDSLHGQIDAAAERAEDSEFKSEIAEFLHDSLSDSATFADWSGRILARLFRGTRLVLFAPHLEEARVLAADVLEREISEPLSSSRQLNEAGAALRELGYAPAIVKAPNECGFFAEMGKRRRKVLFEDGRYVFPEEGIACTESDLRSLLRSSPERFSPNVALRCLVQQRLFSPVAYVAGPGEIAYWAQFKALFDRHGYSMPVVYPRARAVLSTLKLNRLLGEYGLEAADLSVDAERLLQRVLQEVVRNPARDAVARHREAILRGFEQLRCEMERHSDQAAEIARNIERHGREGLDRLDRFLARGDENRRQTVARHLARLGSALMPFRKPQERVYSVCSFLFQYGWDLIPRLIAALDIDSFEMNEVEL